MVGCRFRVLQVVQCWVYFQVAQARILEEWPAGWGGGLIRPTLSPQPPTDEESTVNHDLIRPTLHPTPPTADNLKVETGVRPAIVLDNTIREISKDLYEGDIVLTQEQKLLLQERKATNPANYWPEDSTGTVTVGYRFGDTIINKVLVKVALTHWETNTCIRFKEVTNRVGYVHLNFINADYCASYVGRISSMISGQTVWLYPTCVTEIGPAVHEIGHALGFNHEQSRSDRDDHVKIMWNNIVAGKEGNFDKEVTFNYGVIYDYWSVMHYGPDYFTSNGQNTILAFNPIVQPLMGNRVGLSFADKLMANTMYGCLGKWLTQCSMSSDPCKNMGYTGPACSCVCPEGTSGSQCEVLVASYTDALVKLKTPYSETITTSGTVSTPGYPTPIQTRTKFVKVLVAPACYKVKLTVHDFDVYGRYTDGNCAIDVLIVRTQNALGTGVTYCGKEIAPGTVFISENNTIVLDYNNYDYTTLTWNSTFRGFNATVEHILVDGCTTTQPPATTATPNTTASTTTTSSAPPVVTIINSGNIPLTVSTSSSGLCILNPTSTPGSYMLTSPRHPSRYRAGDSCSVNFRTSEPRYLKVTATSILTTAKEIIYLNSVFSQASSILNTGTGKSYVISSSSTSLKFTPDAMKLGRTFELGLGVLNSDCHQIIKVEAGATGTLTRPNYVANTMCEWWIQAPSGRQIQLVFSAFNVGTSTCTGDFLGIDTSGDPLYKSASKKYCGTTSPNTVISSGGQLNLLLKGIVGRYPGFTATYSVA